MQPSQPLETLPVTAPTAPIEAKTMVPTTTTPTVSHDPVFTQPNSSSDRSSQPELAAAALRESPTGTPNGTAHEHDAVEEGDFVDPSPVREDSAPPSAGMQLWASGSRAAPDAASVLSDSVVEEDSSALDESDRRKKATKAVAPKKPPSSRRVSMEEKQRQEEQKRAERLVAERERRARNSERAAEKRVQREARQIEKRMEKEQILAEKDAEKQRKLNEERDRKEKERQKRENLLKYPMDDAALASIGESTPAMNHGSVLHGSGDPEVLGAAMMAAEFIATFGVGPNNLLNIGTENSVKAVPTFKELHSALIRTGPPQHSVLVDLQVSLVNFLLRNSTAIFANTLLRIDWPVDSTTWTEIVRLMLSHDQSMQTSTDQAHLGSLNTALGEHDYHDLTPVSRAKLLEVLCNMTLDSPEFHARLDTVEQAVQEVVRKEDEARKAERREQIRLRDIEKAERQRLNMNKRQQQMGESIAPGNEQSKVSAEDHAGQAIVSILQEGSDETEVLLAEKVREFVEQAGSVCAPDSQLISSLNELRGNYLGVDRGGRRFWLLRCNASEVISEHDAASYLWQVTRDGANSVALADYIKADASSGIVPPPPQLNALREMEQTLRFRMAQTPPGHEMLALAEVKLREVQGDIYKVIRDAETANVNRRLTQTAPPKLVFTVHDIDSMETLLANLPEKSVREGDLQVAITGRLDSIRLAAEQTMASDRISYIVQQSSALGAGEPVTDPGNNQEAAQEMLPLENVRSSLLEFEESIDHDDYYADKEAYMAKRQDWISKVKAAQRPEDLRQCLLDFQASTSEKCTKNWWKNDVETWQSGVKICKTASLMRLLFTWFLRAFRRMPGTPFPEDEYIIEDKRTPKPKDDQPEMDRREKRRLERLEKDIALAKEASLKLKKKQKTDLEKVEADKQKEVEKTQPAWDYEGHLPDWAFEGALVWAKVWGFPWWPALINAPEDSPGRKRRPSKDDNIWVYNLGAGNFSEVNPAKCIMLYTAENTAKFGIVDKVKASLRKDLKKAMKAAQEILDSEQAAAQQGLVASTNGEAAHAPEPTVEPKAKKQKTS